MNRDRDTAFINQDNLNIRIIFNDVGLLNLITIKNINHNKHYYIDATKIFKNLIKINLKTTWSKTKLITYSFKIIESQINYNFDNNINSLIKRYGIKRYGIKAHLESRCDNLLKNM